jgi:predicted PurR-regulated permease PerM
VIASLLTVLVLALLIVPVAMLAETLVGGIQSLAARFKEGSLIIPAPPAGIETWPIVGAPLSSLWTRASRDLSEALRSLAPQIKAVVPGLVSVSAGLGLTVLQFALSVVVGGVLLANAEAAYEVTSSLCRRVFGEKGLEFQQLIGATIRSVTSGIGMLVLIPAVIYMFAIASATKAVIFLVWCIAVGLMDNFLKPILLGRGVAVPMAVVFLGAIGGFVALGLIGLFVGAIVLSVGYKLFLAWLDQSPTAAEET